MVAKRLSKETEQKLTRCVGRVADYVADGLSPTEALEKVASDNHLQPGHISLVASAFNTGQVLAKLDSDGTPQEKAAAVPLADAKTVLDRLFPEQIKSASDRLRERVVSDDYRLQPKDIYAKHREREAMTKVAQYFPESLSEAEKPTDPGHDLLDRRRELRKKMAALQQSAVHLETEIRDTRQKLARYFLQDDNIAFDTVLQNVKLTRGESAAKLLAGAVNSVGLPKRASAYQPYRHDDIPYRLTDRLVQAVQESQEKLAAFQKVQKEAEETEKQAAAMLERPIADRPVYGSILSEKRSSAVPLMVGAVAGQPLGKLVEHAIKVDPKEQAAKVVDRRLSTPEHEDKIRSIRANTLLYDLMTSDPVISNYDFDSVVDAYNQISQLAPSASLRRPVVQSLLRRYLEQGNQLDLYDQKELVELNKNINTPNTVKKVVVQLGQ